jgi:hypothetical protein
MFVRRSGCCAIPLKNETEEGRLGLAIGHSARRVDRGEGSPEKAAAAAEEVAGYENRLTRLATWVQICVAMLLLLLGSQGALWIEIGKLDGRLSALSSQTSDMRGQLAQISAQLERLTH